MWDYELAPEADAELREAVAYYDSQREGLGDEFVSELWKTINTIRRMPLEFALISKHSRRRQVRRFPYGVIYNISGEKIRIIAIMHLNRRPGYWEGRT